MSTQNQPNRSLSFLTRSSAVALLLSGMALALGNLLHPDNKADAMAALSHPLWQPAHAAILASVVLMLYGLAGFHAGQEARIGRLGKLGYVMTIIGTALFVGAIMVDGFVMPVVVGTPAANALDNSSLLPIFLATGVVFALGLILFAVATVRAGAYASWPVVVTTCGGALTAFGDPLPHALTVAAGIVFAIGLIGMGYALLGRTRMAAGATGALIQ